MLNPKLTNKQKPDSTNTQASGFWKYLFFFVFSFLLFFCCSKKEKVNDYNVLFISIDTLRADHTSYHGYQRKTTPFIDDMAEKSYTFFDASVQSSKTLPSIASMMTSMYPGSINITSNGHVLSHKFLTMAEVMKKHRFYTIAYTTNGVLISKKGIAQGFDEFYFYPDNASQLTERAINRLKKGFELNKKLFMWLHYIDPHGPYTPPAPYNEVFIRDNFYDPSFKVNLEYTPLKGYNKNYILGAVPIYQQQVFKGDTRKNELDFYISQYDGEIRYIDEEIKRLINYLNKSKLLKKTIVIFTSDHGEALGEHNYYFEHGWFVYQDQIHVPLFIYIPDTEKGKKIREPIELIDLAPTIFEMLKIPIPKSFQGSSLLPLIVGKSRDKSFIYSKTPKGYPNIYKTLRFGEWKYIIDNNSKEEFYNLATDLRETINIADNKNKYFFLLKERIQIVSAIFENIYKKEKLKKKIIDQKVRKNLEALGYL